MVALTRLLSLNLDGLADLTLFGIWISTMSKCVCHLS